MQHRTARPLAPGAFTMIELVVAMGVIVLIGSIMIVVFTGALKSADRTRIAFQFQTISAALEAYKTDFNAYPITSLDNSVAIGPTPSAAQDLADAEINRDGLRGARTLCKALLGAGPQGTFTTGGAFDLVRPDQDGAEGFGFRVVPRSGVVTAVDVNKTVGNASDDEFGGKVYGPYLAPDKFKVSRTNTDGSLTSDSKTLGGQTYKFDDTSVILDANDHPILYYPVLNPQPRFAVAKGFIGPTGPTRTATTEPLPMYRSGDNSAWLKPEDFATLMGDVRNATGGPDAYDGAISPAQPPNVAEVATTKGKYILYSPGPDGFYGPNLNDPRVANIPPKERRARLDDVTNIAGD